MRRVDLLPALREELARLPRGRPDDLVFAAATGGALSQSNIRNRILAPAVEIANEQLEQRGEVPLPEHLSPHKL